MSRLEYLYEKCMAAEAGAAEQQEFLQLLRLEENALVAKQLIARAYNTPKEVVDVNEESSKAILEAIFKAAASDSTPVRRMSSLNGGKHFLKTAWFRYAAAILIIVTVVGLYYGLFYDPKPGTKVVQTTPPSVPARDVLPGSDRAVLTLSNGSKVELNKAASETITDGTLAIENENGELSYSGSLSSAGGGGREAAGGGLREARTATYNTMTTPKGGQYKLTLADGTKVWLNAASSITYPTAFTGKTREVSVTGEAYFEVNKNKEKPFIVIVASSYPPLAGVAAERPEVDRERSERTTTYRIEVLGTSFNVNAYPDEPSMKTSLLEGSVKISSAGGGGREAAGGGSREARTATGVILKPGQAFTNGKVTPTNLTQDIAWKNGFFNFDEIDLQAMLRQISRWYDVDIQYKGKIPQRKFGGRMRRDLNLSGVLKLLDNLGIKYQLQEKTLVIQ